MGSQDKRPCPWTMACINEVQLLDRVIIIAFVNLRASVNVVFEVVVVISIFFAVVAIISFFCFNLVVMLYVDLVCIGFIVIVVLDMNSYFVVFIVVMSNFDVCVDGDILLVFEGWLHACYVTL